MENVSFCRSKSSKVKSTHLDCWDQRRPASHYKYARRISQQPAGSLHPSMRQSGLPIPLPVFETATKVETVSLHELLRQGLARRTI